MRHIYFENRVFTVLGLGLVLYQYYLEYNFGNFALTPFHGAATDTPCASIAWTPYGKMFGLLYGNNLYDKLSVSNTVIGLFYHVFFFASTFLRPVKALLIAQGLLCLTSWMTYGYLNYIFFFELHKFCLIALLLYFVSLCNLISLLFMPVKLVVYSLLSKKQQ